MDDTRRSFLLLGGAALLASGCRKEKEKEHEKEEKEPEVGAVEDLMREHGILRRALVVYREIASRLRTDAAASVPPDVLQKTAKLFRSFGEDYHEKAVEEPFVLPAVKRAGGPAAAYVDVILEQHKRGREITDWIIAVTQAPKLNANGGELARVLDGFARMYESHAAREDTIVFPAWKTTLSKKQLEEMGDKLEDIEHKQFGKDGFEDAEKQMSAIEAQLGLSSLATFDAPPPPRA